jgi:hypothetical protein
MSDIRFHIGAHKTATTHLQMTLAGCAFAAGTRYVPLKRLRVTLTSPVRNGRPRIPWHRWHKGTWLFSDENILGTTENSLRMYPDPARDLRYFLDCGLSVFLCVRRYDTFLASAYGERLWRHRYRPFEAVPPARRWPDVLRDLQDGLPGVPVHVWRYEDYREHAAAIAQFYAGGAIEAFGPPLEEDPKSGFSARAVEAMARFSDRRPRKTQVLAIRSANPIGPNSPRFNPWSEAQQAELAAMYAADLEALAQMATLWTPTGDSSAGEPSAGEPPAGAHSPKR